MKKSHGNILIYSISYKTLIWAKPLCIRFDKTGGFIRIYDGTTHLRLLHTEKYDYYIYIYMMYIYDSIRCLINLKSSITYISSQHFAKIKVDSYDYLPIEKN